MSDEQLLVTHNSKFHADDVFAIATIGLLLEQNNKHWQVIRTRDPEDICKGDYVVDVGGVYDADADRFDHHQIGGAGKRDNGIPYASFGLVWKKYGETISGNREVAEKIDQKLVQPIDAHDNGVEVVKDSLNGLYPYDLQQLKYILLPTWKEETDLDEVFKQAVMFAQTILKRQIKVAQDEEEGCALVLDAYHNTEDKRVIMIDERLPWKEVLAKFQEPLYVMYKKRVTNTWSVKTVSIDPTGLGLLEHIARKPFPKEWAGKRDKELEEVTGVSGALFCHNNLFLVVAQTKEAAIELAQIALRE